MEDSTILYHITEDQADKICSYFGEDANQLEEYEIGSLLDRIIDEL